MTSPPSGAAIRAAYRHAGMNRSQFQRAMGVAYSTILNWERGRTRPNADHLELISRVTGVAIDDLLREDRRDSPIPDPVLQEFLGLPVGRTVTPHERSTLESVVFHGMTPTLATYHAFLVGLRMAEDAKPTKRRRSERRPRK